MKKKALTHISLTRQISLPDEIKLALFKKSPELGPKILFFSGGTALTEASKVLTQYTHNSIHIITPFDSGGSSATLRKYFNMPAIGDLRSRIMALADRSLIGNIEVIELFSYRFSKEKNNNDLRNELHIMSEAKHSLVCALPIPVQRIICSYLQSFISYIDDSFPLQGASLGNIILTSCYVRLEREIDSVMYLFSQLVGAKGKVFPVTDSFAHLAVELEDKSAICGQNNFTGKEKTRITSPIKKMWLCPSIENESDTQPNTPLNSQPNTPLNSQDEEKTNTSAISSTISASRETIQLIKEAELICYPMGSFFSSLIANLLPEGVVEAICQNPCPKIFIPSKGHDPELFGFDINKQVNTLIEYLLKGCKDKDVNNVLNFIVLDSKSHKEKLNLDSNIEQILYPLSKRNNDNYFCPERLIEVLLSLC